MLCSMGRSTITGCPCEAVEWLRIDFKSFIEEVCYESEKTEIRAI